MVMTILAINIFIVSVIGVDCANRQSVTSALAFFTAVFSSMTFWLGMVIGNVWGF